MKVESTYLIYTPQSSIDSMLAELPAYRCSASRYQRHALNQNYVLREGGFGLRRPVDKISRSIEHLICQSREAMEI